MPFDRTTMHAIARNIADVGAELFAAAAARKPVKVLSRETGLPERYIAAVRRRERSPSWAAAIALANSCPELRAAMFRWLGVTAPVIDARDEAALAAALEAYARAKQDGGNDCG